MGLLMHLQLREYWFASLTKRLSLRVSLLICSNILVSVILFFFLIKIIWYTKWVDDHDHPLAILLSRKKNEKSSIKRWAQFHLGKTWLNVNTWIEWLCENLISEENLISKVDTASGLWSLASNAVCWWCARLSSLSSNAVCWWCATGVRILHFIHYLHSAYLKQGDWLKSKPLNHLIRVHATHIWLLLVQSGNPDWGLLWLVDDLLLQVRWIKGLFTTPL